jgi:pimeloyl-ACP methyl ester carboxylesterase
MPKYRGSALAGASIAVALCLVGGTLALETPPVKVVVDSRIVVRGAAGEGLLPVAVSQDWSRPLPEVSRAVVVIHGAHRTADHYFRMTTRLAPDSRTLIVAPQFLLERDIAAHSLPDAVLRWGRGDWATGGDAAGPVAVSSYEAIDALLLILADRSRFPNLTRIVLAGFSGGGQLTQRYAAVGRGTDALTGRSIAPRYVVGSPSSYLYFTEDRPRPEGGSGPFAGAAECPNFNRWPYGFAGGLPRYVAAPAGGAASLERRYAGRDVVYLLGTADNDPNHWELDKSCAGEAEGPDRYTRGVKFFRYLQGRNAAILRQRLWSAPGAGHDPELVFGSPCGRAALFDALGCQEG